MKKIVLQPVHLAWILGILFSGLLLAISPWLSAVFRGDVILNQNMVSLKLDYLNLFGYQIPFTDISVRFYSVIMLFAFAAGYALTLFLVRRSFLPDSLVDRLIIGIVLFGLLGARLFFVIFNIPTFFGNVVDFSTFLQALGRAFLIYEGGLAISGGTLAVVAYLWWFTKRYQFKFLEVSDLLVPGLLLGQVIGRWGNFFNYEAYGAPTNVFWKMFVPENAINANKYVYTEELARYFHPTFLYESLANLVLLLFVLSRYSRLTARSAGLVTAVYLIGYGLIRTITEFFRLDALKIPLNMDVNLPSNIANFFGNVLPSGLREPFVFWLENLRIDGILVSQLVAFGMLVVGILLYRKRAGVVYSPSQQTDVT